MIKGRIDSKIYDVVDSTEYSKNKDMYDPEYTAVIKDNLLYPIRGRKVDRSKPGYYFDGTIGIYVKPKNEEEYSTSNIIDFSSTDNIKDLLEKSTALKDMERDILTNPDNIFIPVIDEYDEPEMKGLKEAIIAKKIDLEKYKQRFGKDYNNDRKLFNRHDITIKKLKSFADKLDMKLTLILEDKDETVPNPIGRVIVVNLNDQINEDGDE